MKKLLKDRFLLFFLISTALCITSGKTYSQPTPPYLLPQYDSEEYINIKTPTGVDLEAVIYTDISEWVAYWEALGTYLIETYQWYSATRLSPATHEYNCHGYAWYVSEGENNACIYATNRYNNNNLPKYWSGSGYSYETTESEESGRKILYIDDDHSAITTSSSSFVKSKWGYLPLYEHYVYDCPYDYTNLVYYELSPNMTGSTSIICNNVERYYNTNISNMNGATLTWTSGPNIEIISGAETPELKVRGTSDGNSYINLQITTPSGFSWSDSKNFYAGIQPLYSVSGPSEGYEYNTYYFYTSPQRDSHSEAEYTWVLNPLNGNDVRPYFDYADIAFYNPYDYYQVVVKAQNTCGATDWVMTNIVIYDGDNFKVSPNPASDIVQVSISDPITLDASYEKEKPVNYKVKIIDYNGTLFYSGTKTGPNFTLPVSNLKDGSYIVNLNYGKKTKSIPLIIKH